MDSLRASEIIMNYDSEDSNLDYLDDDFDIQTNDSETDSTDDAVQAASSAQGSTFQVRTAQQQDIWHPAARQPPVTMFMGM